MEKKETGKYCLKMSLEMSKGRDSESENIEWKVIVVWAFHANRT